VQYTTAYTATTTIAVPDENYVGNYDDWVVVYGPQNHCYVTNVSPDSTYPGSEAYADALNACVNTGEFGIVDFVYSSNLNEWLCYSSTYVFLSILMLTYRLNPEYTCDSSVTTQGYLAFSVWTEA